MRFFVEADVQKVTISGRCGGVAFTRTIATDWKTGGDPQLQESDFVVHGSVPFYLVWDVLAVEIPELQDCFRDYDSEVFCLQFMNVTNFRTISVNEEYTLSAVLLRARFQ
jgi:hypothetical protein